MEVREITTGLNKKISALSIELEKYERLRDIMSEAGKKLDAVDNREKAIADLDRIIVEKKAQYDQLVHSYNTDKNSMNKDLNETRSYVKDQKEKLASELSVATAQADKLLKEYDAESAALQTKLEIARKEYADKLDEYSKAYMREEKRLSDIKMAIEKMKRM